MLHFPGMIDNGNIISNKFEKEVKIVNGEIIHDHSKGLHMEAKKFGRKPWMGHSSKFQNPQFPFGISGFFRIKTGDALRVSIVHLKPLRMNSPSPLCIFRLTPRMTTCKIPAFAVASHPQAILIEMFLRITLH